MSSRTVMPLASIDWEAPFFCLAEAFCSPLCRADFGNCLWAFRRVGLFLPELLPSMLERRT